MSELKNYMMDADDVAKALSVSKGQAYKTIRILNEELKAQGVLRCAGKSTKRHTGKQSFMVSIRRKGEDKMAIYKDDKTWTVQCRIKNRDGTTKQHKKRGFLTKKEAKEYESKITSKISKCHMKLSEFYEIYLTDKKNELKYRTILTKRQMIENIFCLTLESCRWMR